MRAKEKSFLFYMNFSNHSGEIDNFLTNVDNRLNIL